MLPLKGEGEATRCVNGAHIPEEAIEPFVVPQLENGEERICDGGHTSDIVDGQAVRCACLVLGRDGKVAGVRAAVLATSRRSTPEIVSLEGLLLMRMFGSLTM